MRQKPLLFTKYLAATLDLNWVTSVVVQILQLVYLLFVDIDYQRSLLCTDMYYETSNPQYTDCFNTANPSETASWGSCPSELPSGVGNFDPEQFSGTWYEKYRDRTVWYKPEET